MRAEAYMYPEPGQNYASSSPRFLNPNYSFWVGNVTYSISQPAIDPDFDSIYYELIDLKGGSYGPVDYVPGYSGTSPFGPNIPVFINQNTGEISALNLQMGIWSLNLRVSSFKNGILVKKGVKEEWKKQRYFEDIKQIFKPKEIEQLCKPKTDSIHSAIGKFSFVADTSFLKGKSNAVHKVWGRGRAGYATISAIGSLFLINQSDS